MKKILIIILALILVIGIVNGYQWTNTSDYNMNMEFAGGGLQEKQEDYNHTVAIGGAFIPFNVSSTDYNLYQGILYIIWSDETITDIVVTITITHNVSDSLTVPDVVSVSNIFIVEAKMNASGNISDVYAYLNVGPGFYFLAETPQNRSVGSLWTHNTTTVRWLLSAPSSPDLHGINVTYTINNTQNGTAENVFISKEVNEMGLSIMLFVMVINIAVFILPFRVTFTKNQIADHILKRCCVLLGLFLLSLNTGVAASVADYYGLDVLDELFRYLWLVNWTIYITMFAVVVMAIFSTTKLLTDIKTRERMGDDGMWE